MVDQINEFCLVQPVKSCEPYGNGHINETFLAVDSDNKRYILQKINKNVFKDPYSLMENIVAVTTYLGKMVTDSRESLILRPTLDGKMWLVDKDEQHWRLYDFVEDNICLEKAETSDDFKESAIAFGRFQRQLADFPAHTLTETIPRFHDTVNRYKDFKAAVAADVKGRTKSVEREIEFALEREGYAGTLLELQKSGDLPLRVTHNDTKLNNVLFDKNTRKALCVIDLDTVMPGLSVNDFGDSIRFGASTAVEDERDLDKVHFSVPLFTAYTEGFISVCGKSLTKCEIDHMIDGAKMMTLECGIRFLADHLAGDTYFHIHRENHNLDRARTQFRLVAEMEEKWEEIRKIVSNEYEKL